MLSWRSSGFSAHADEPARAQDRASLERVVRHITRAPIRIDAIHIDDEGRTRITTPPESRETARPRSLSTPWSGSTPSPARSPTAANAWFADCGAYASRTRAAGRFGARRLSTEKRSEQDRQQAPEQKRSRASWARLLRRILEVDPLLCSRCGIEMTIVSVITDPTPRSGSAGQSSARIQTPRRHPRALYSPPTAAIVLRAPFAKAAPPEARSAPRLELSPDGPRPRNASPLAPTLAARPMRNPIDGKLLNGVAEGASIGNIRTWTVSV